MRKVDSDYPQFVMYENEVDLIQKAIWCYIANKSKPQRSDQLDSHMKELNDMHNIYQVLGEE